MAADSQNTAARVARSALLIVQNGLRWGPAHFKLCIHFLQARSKRFNLFLLACDSCALFLVLSVLFQKLIQQHRVHCVVPHGIDFAVLIAHHQVGVHLGYFLGNQTELRRAFAVALVVKAHRLKRQDRFAGLVHRFNLMLEPPRGTLCAQLPCGIYNDWYGRVHCLNPANVADKTTVVHVRTCKIPTDTDNVIGVSDAGAGIYAQADVEVAARYVAERSSTDRRVVVAARIAERLRTNGGVFAAGDVVLERSRTDGGVFAAGSITSKRQKTSGRVVGAGSVAEERNITICRVPVARGVAKECFKTGGRIAAASAIVHQRLLAVGSVEAAGGVGKKRLKTIGRVIRGGVRRQGAPTKGGVAEAADAAQQRIHTHRGVVVASDVAKEGECTIGRVVTAGIVKGKRVYSIGCVTRAGSIEQKRCSTGGRVVVCGVEIKRSSTNSGIEAAGGDTRQRKCTNCCIPNARGETPKSVVPLRSGEVGITSVRRRDNGLCCLWDDKAGQQERNEK